MRARPSPLSSRPSSRKGSAAVKVGAAAAATAECSAPRKLRKAERAFATKGVLKICKFLSNVGYSISYFSIYALYCLHCRKQGKVTPERKQTMDQTKTTD